MKKIIVNLNKRSYPIIITDNIFNDPHSFFLLQSASKTIIITNKILAKLYLKKIICILKKINIKVDSIILPDGEKSKSLKIVDVILTALLNKSCDRDTVLIAFGGGVIGDLTGFVASIYHRGIRFIQLPTTLLSQVDSAIGGKTAINHPLGKNMIGTFYQPISIISYIHFLKTLPTRVFISGLSEVIKYAIILDDVFFSWIEKNINALLNLEYHALKYCIQHCCKLKSEVITKDEYERNNFRIFLNLGHTFGHAIETAMGYRNWLHGEAVAVGIVMAAYTSEKIGQFTKENRKRIVTLFNRAKLPIQGPRNMSAQTYYFYMMKDKKSLGEKLNLVLPCKIGKREMIIYSIKSKNILIDIINDYQKMHTKI